MNPEVGKMIFKPPVARRSRAELCQSRRPGSLRRSSRRSFPSPSENTKSTATQVIVQDALLPRRTGQRNASAEAQEPAHCLDAMSVAVGFGKRLAARGMP